MNKLIQHWSPILKYFKMNDFFYLLFDIDKTSGDPLITPSKYNIEMSINTEERLEKLKSLSRKVKMRSEPSVNTLKITPDIVIFQKYKIGDFLSVPVTVLNAYDVSKPVHVLMESTTTFSISYPSDTVCSKIAPGMTYQFNVNFYVHEVKEYCYPLTVETDCEKLKVLIVCIHPRPLLDIPDTITLPTTPVKIVAERVLLVRNMGEVPAIFNMVAAPPFSVQPDRGILGPGKNLQLSLSFKTATLGEHTGRLTITYETTEHLTVNLKACASEANITLECTNIEIPDTYMGLKRRRFIKLFNNSSHLVYFKWKRYKNIKEALRENVMYREGFKSMKELESAKWFGRVYQGIVDSKQTHEMIYDRIYQDEVREYESHDKFLYQNPNWAIHPLKGEIWPESSAMFIVEFIPTHSTFYESTMYLEVAGKQERIPLYVSGRGLGPSLELNLVELDANDIFLCAEHQYEVAVHNKGHIPGHISYKPTPPNFGGVVNFNPTSLSIEAGCYAAFVMKFSSKIQGKFVEDIEFVIKESEEVLKFVFKGNIICPLLNFDVADVDFGKVTLGYPITRSIKLINTTQVPIEYKVSIVQDGDFPAITCEQYAQEVHKPFIYMPKEFTFTPEEDIVAPNFTLNGELTLLANIEGIHSKRLYLIMWGTSKYSLSLPIRYKCMTPEIECKTKDIFMRGCFINYVYTRTVVLTNLNEHPGYLMFVPQEIDNNQHIKYKPQVPEDFIDAYETKEVQLDISTSFVGQSTAHVYISIFGGKEKMFICSIRCNGQGPVITVPDVMNFDEIRTLREVTQTMEVINDSPVPATVTITQNKKSVFKISDSKLQLDPTEKKELEVKVYLREPGRYSDKLIFSATNSECQTCSLYVRGIGSSILSEPELEQEVNLGYLLTHTPFNLPVKFTNMGKRGHKIIWSRIKRLKSFKEDQSTIIPSVFSLTPCCFDLAPGQSIQCTLAGTTTTIGMVEEDFYCHALIEKNKDFGVVSSFILTAHFVKPFLQLSKREMRFRVDTTVDKSIAFLHDTLEVKNLSKLEITTNVNIDPPFFIIQNGERVSFTIITLADGASQTFIIEFAPRNKEKKCTVATGKLVLTHMGHPYKDSIPLIGEENYPNLLFEPREIDFGSLPNFYSATEKIILKNISPLPVSFHWEWLKNDFQLDFLESKPINYGTTRHEEEEFRFRPYSSPNIPKTLQIRQYSFEDVKDLTRKHRKYELSLPNLRKYAAVMEEPEVIETVVEIEEDRLPQYFDKMRVYLYQLVECYNDPEKYLRPLNLLPESVNNPECIREILDLIPSYGYLGPYESQVVSFEFNPCPNTVISAKVQCHLKGGITEVIPVKGKSSNISFSIESNIIEFGRQLFCEICEKKVLIKNTGHTDLDVQVITKPQKTSDVGIVPSFAYFEVITTAKDKDVEITVRYFPGVAAEFKRPFIVQVGYLEPYTMTMHGYAMPAQVFCLLPRPSLAEEKATILSYKAIGKITSETLKSVRNLIPNSVHYKEDIHYKIREKLSEEGWGIICHLHDIVPSEVDIQMATEREAIDEILKNDQSVLNTHMTSKSVNAIPIEPAFPYLIDFKFVVRDTVDHYTTTIVNYGPLKNEIKLLPLSKNLFQSGFNAYISKSKLDVGESTDLVVVFSPSSKVFNTVDTEIKDYIYLIVPHGQRIPIEVRAFVTIPCISSKQQDVNFETVVLGNCVRKSIVLENKGYVQSNWYAKLDYDNGQKNKNSRPIFFIKVTSGILKPNDSILFDIYFQPTIVGKLKASLVLTVEENDEKVIVNLKGIGYKNGIKIDNLNINFTSTLPYSQNAEVIFTIENPGIFPVEFFFSDFDEIVDAEERIIKILMDYYQTNYLFLPERNPGKTLPKPIYDFYQTIIDRVGQKIWQEELDKIVEQASIVSPLNDKEGIIPKALSPKISKKISSNKSLKDKKSINSGGSKLLKSRSKSATITSSKVSGKQGSLTTSSLTKKPKTLQVPSKFSLQDLLNRKQSEQLETYIKEELQNWRTIPGKSTPILCADPVKEALEERKVRLIPNDTADIKKGILIIFHGAPYTNYLQAAYKAGLKLKLPTCSIDQMLLDALVLKDSLAAIKINELINNAFKSIASDTDLTEAIDFDDHDRLQKKINLLLTGKTISKSKSRGQSKDNAKDVKSGKSESKRSSGKGSNDKGSKDTKDSKVKVDKRPTFIGLPEDLLYEILEKRITMYEDGLIIPTLDSLFVKQPLQVLNWILLSVKNTRYIHFILLSYTFQDDTQQTEVVKEQEEKKDVHDKKAQLETIMDMDADEFENITIDEWELFKNEVLIPRKVNMLKKQEQIKLRILMKSKGIKVEKSKSKDMQKIPKSVLNATDLKKKKETTEKDAKKGKKDGKPKGTSKGSSKESKDNKSKLGLAKGKKPDMEQLERKKNLDIAENLAGDILHTLEYWNRETCTLTKDLSAKRSAKQSKSKSKGGSVSSKKSAPSEIPPTQLREFTDKDMKEALSLGIPCWFLNNVTPEKADTIIHFLENNKDLMFAKEELKGGSNDLEPSTEIFTVIHKPSAKKRVANVSDIFALYSITQRGAQPESVAFEKDTNSQLSSLSKLSIKKKTSSMKKVKGSKESVASASHSVKSVNTISITEPSIVDEVFTTELTKRSVLNRGEKMSFRVTFNPKVCGNYQHNYTIELVGWPIKYTLNCSGACDIPKLVIEPSIMFENCFESRAKMKTQSNAYLADEKLFEFGPILISSYANHTRLLEQNANLVLQNGSSLPCNAQLVFLHTTFPPSTDVFKLNKSEVTIESNKCEVVTVSAQPTNVGNCLAQLAIIISNNPKVQLINFNCLGVDYQFYVEPNEIAFERTLLNKVSTKSFVLYNESLIPVVWKILEPDNVLQYFKVTPLKGFMGPCTRQNVQVSFVASVLEATPNVEMDVQVLHGKSKTPIALQVLKVQLSAEVLNIEIDCPRQVDFGEVKARKEHNFEITILSKIKYNMDFTFGPVTKYPNIKQDEAYRSLFKATPETLTLNYGKPATATITFYSKKCVDFTNIPIFKCVVIDPPSQNIMTSFVITGSAKSYLSSYQLCPPTEIYFGHQLVGTEKSEQLTLRNTGKFDFTFTVMSLKQVIADTIKKSNSKLKVKATKKGKGTDKKALKKDKSVSTKSTKTENKSKISKTSSKLGTDKKGKKNKNANMKKSDSKTNQIKVEVGCFNVMLSSGPLQPHETAIITVTSKPKTIGLTEEIIVFFISESPVEHKKGIPILLSVKGDTPSVDFTYIQDIFCEQYIVETVADFNCPHQMGNHCYYVKNEQAMYFSKTCINNTTTTRLRFQSTCAIVTELFAEILNGTVFTVKPERTQLDAFEHVYLDVSFTPKSITEYSEMLEVKYNTSIGEPVRCNVELKGEGFVPELRIIEPMVDEISNKCRLIFNPLFVGKSQIKQIVLENIGTIECKVMLEVTESTNMVYFRVVQEENAQCITRHSAVMSIQPNSKSECEIEFKPTEPTKLEATISVFIVNNPFEFFNIQVLAESFMEDIILENVPALSTSEYKADKNPIAAYNIDFGCCPLNSLQKKVLKIKNNSVLNIYRFEFPSIEKVVFIPAVGHLKPASCKDIIVTFLSREPIMVQAEPLELVITQIQYVEAEIEPLSWDERQNMITWISDYSSADPSKSSTILSSQSQEGHSRKSSRGRDKSASASTKTRTKPTSKDAITDTDPSPEIATFKRKKIETKTEPAHEILAESIKIITLVFSINADYCNYNVDVEDIKLEDTLMFEKRTATFTIKNPSIMPVLIDWFVEIDSSVPRKIRNLSSWDSTNRSVKSADARSVQHPKMCTCTPGIKYHLTGHEEFMHNQDKSSRPISSYSSTESTSSKITDLDLPFTIDPAHIEIPPNTDKTFLVTFAPIDAFEYLVHLKSCIPNVYPKSKPLDITVKAKSLMPLYHFDIAPSDYLTNQRYGRKLCGDLSDENTKVVEIEGIGLGISHTKSFHITNPTGESFNYKWVPSAVNTDDIHLFHCQTPKGHVFRGKLAKCTFSFLPQQLGTFEGFYTFIIEKYNLKTTFLFVGKARNPCVFFSVPHLKLQSTLLNMVTSNNVLLKNNEDVELHFKIIKKSCYNGHRTDKIIVEPMEGNLGRKSEVPMRICCTPVTTGDIHFNLQCEIERMDKPLLLTVKTSAFEVEPIIFQMVTGGKSTLDHKNDNTTILRSMVVNQEDISKFVIKNDGKIGFYYKWSKLDKFIDDFVNVKFKEVEGYCKAGEEREAVVILKPIRHVVEKNVKLKINILYGPEYKVNFVCTTARSKYKFSFTEYDFGPCLVQKEKVDVYKCLLQFSHNETSPVLLEYKDDNHDHLTVVFRAKEIAPKVVATIPIWFHPLRPEAFITPLLFSVNGKPEKIIIKAKGVLPDLVLEDHDDRFVNFGAVLIGRTVSKTIKVVNRTPTTVNVVFNMYEMLPYFSKRKKKLESEFERPMPRKRKVVGVKDEKEVNDEKEPTDKKKKGKKDDKKGVKKPTSVESSQSIKSKLSKKDDKKGVNKPKSVDSSQSIKSKVSSHSKSSIKSSASMKSRESKTSVSSLKMRRKRSSRKKMNEGTSIEAVDTPEYREKLIKKSLGISPKQSIKLPPAGRGGFIITFSPTARMQPFNKKIYYQIQDTIEPICIAQGSCIAPEYYIDRNKISFGSVVKGCHNETKFTLYNTGDIGGKYKWSIDRNKVAINTKVTISPIQGYISPDTSVTFSVKYQPNTIQCYTRLKMICKIEKYNKPLEVVLTGSCTNAPPPASMVEFQCPVRSTTEQTITICNSTDTKWKIHPQLTGSYFSVPDTIYCEPNSSTDCKVTYNPLCMTLGDSKHTAKLYFTQPIGVCTLYRLQGVAVGPEPIEKIEKTIFCKEYYTEILNIKNWSKDKQQFKVITKNLKPEETIKILYKLTGNNFIDVPGSAERDYYWGIYVLNVGILHFQVTFRNEKTKEYLFYEIQLTIVQGGPQKEISLTTCVRQKVSHELYLKNPIKVPVIYFLKCTSSDLQFQSEVTVRPLREEPVTLDYFPLFADEQEVVLTADTEELGQYNYKIFLTAKAPIPETPVYLKCCLGQSSTQKVFIHNFTKMRSDYTLKFSDNETFIIRPELLSVDPGVKGQFEVTFQPIELGNVDGTLKVTSITAGEYIYPLRGICEIPKPQGPVKVPITSGTTIAFKNPFKTQVKFNFLTESKVFTISNTSETLDPFASTKIEIYVKIEEPVVRLQNYPYTGKLIVMCADPPKSNIKWVYYLQSE